MPTTRWKIPTRWRCVTGKTLMAQKMHSAVDYTCYEGMKINGAVERVMLRGKTIVLNGEFTGERGGGQYQHRGTSSLA